MNEPYLAIYVKNGALYFTKKLPTEDLPREILEVEISELIADQFEDASKKLGGTVLGILSLWHKDLFHDWGVPSNAVESLETEDYDLAMELIHKSVKRKTSIHVSSIDALFRQQKITGEQMRILIEESWPTIRERLESFTPNGEE